MDKKTGDKSKTRPRFVKQDQVCIARLRAAGVICLETFKDFPQMGRFTLRDEGGNTDVLIKSAFYIFKETTSINHNFLPHSHLYTPSSGKTIAIGKVLKLVPEKD